MNELRQQHIYRNTSHSRNYKAPEVGDIVLIRDDKPLPRQKWRLCKIEKVIRGRDNFVRGVKLIVASKDGSRNVCHRPLQKIIPLEIVDAIEPKNEAINEGRPKRKAAVQGQILRRLRETYG